MHLADEVGLTDLHRRHVDAAGSRATALPGRAWRSPRSRTQSPIGHDQSGTFGDRHELVGRDVAVLRMVPADQRLGADHLARAEVDERHVT